MCLLCLTHTGAQAALKITLQGLDAAQRDNVLQYLSLRADAPPTSTIHLRRLFHQAPDEIRTGLQALGYYQPVIASKLQQHGADWEARFTIQPGAPVRIRTMDCVIEPAPGATEPAIKTLLAAVPLHRHDILHHGRYERIKHDWRVFAEEHGYLDARFTEHRVTVDLKKLSAEVHLHFALGPRYRLGAVHFKQEGYDSAYLARFVPFKPDVPFLASQLQELRNRLENTDNFSSVDVSAPRERARQLVIPVTVTLTNRPKYKITTGVGYGTDTGPRISLGWDNRHINSAGHTFSSTVTVSGISTGVSALYSIPLRDPTRESLAFQASWQKQNTESADNRVTTLGARLTTVRAGNWLQTIFLNAQQESFQVGADRGITRLLLPGVNWTRTRQHASRYLQSGDRLFAELKGSNAWLGSSTRFLQSQAQGRWIGALNSDSRLLARLDLGATLVSAFSELPASYRFFAGGDHSVRGYAFQSLGPRDASGAVVGGRYLVVGSLEYERRVYNKWSVAVFYDAGNALNALSDPLQHGAGFGVRWQTPIGPVRVDLASALDEPGHPWRLHIYFGPDL